MSDIKGLIERLEGDGEGEPSRALDYAIVRALCPHAIIRTYVQGDEEETIFHAEPLVPNKTYAPNYTASIDAALTLVPVEDSRNFEVCLEQTKRGQHRWNAIIGHMTYDAWEGCSPSPAIAICIAALKARSA